MPLPSFAPALGVVLRRRRVELPAMAIALFELALAAEFLSILVLEADRCADLFHDILVWRRIVPTRSFVANEVGRLRIGVNVTGRHPCVSLRQLIVQTAELCPSGPRGAG